MCDVELNEHTARFLLGNEFDRALQRYRAEKLDPLIPLPVHSEENMSTNGRNKDDRHA